MSGKTHLSRHVWLSAGEGATLAKCGSDSHLMGQIWPFFRADFRAKVYFRTFWKTARFVPLGGYLTHFEAKSDITDKFCYTEIVQFSRFEQLFLVNFLNPYLVALISNNGSLILKIKSCKTTVFSFLFDKNVGLPKNKKFQLQQQSSCFFLLVKLNMIWKKYLYWKLYPNFSLQK